MLDTAEEKQEFLEEFEPDSLFYRGKKRASTMAGPRRCFRSPRAPEVIHFDLEREFIRAEEVFKYSELVFLGSEVGREKNGKFYVEGRNIWCRAATFSIFAFLI